MLRKREHIDFLAKVFKSHIEAGHRTYVMGYYPEIDFLNIQEHTWLKTCRF